MQLFCITVPARKAGFLFHLTWAVLIITLIMTACGTSATPTPTTEPIPQSDPYPQTYTDALERSVSITARPEAIVSLAPSVTEMLYAIGAGSQVVARTDYDNYPLEVEALPSVGGFDASTISVESILNLEPDLVIGGSLYQADLAKTLEEAGLTIIVIEPDSVADIQDAMLTLGAITGHTAEAEAAVLGMQSRIDAVAEKVAAIPDNERLTVFYEVWHEPLMTTSNKTFIGELIEMAGGVNIFADLSETYPTVSAEQIIEQSPDVILGPSNHSDQLTAEVIAARPGWENLAAVQQEAIYIIDGDIVSRAGPRVIDALELIAAALYPDRFGG